MSSLLSLFFSLYFLHIALLPKNAFRPNEPYTSSPPRLYLCLARSLILLGIDRRLVFQGSRRPREERRKSQDDDTEKEENHAHHDDERCVQRPFSLRHRLHLFYDLIEESMYTFFQVSYLRLNQFHERGGDGHRDGGGTLVPTLSVFIKIEYRERLTSTRRDVR